MGRTLIYIPVIHTDPDLGSLAVEVEEKTASLLGSYWKQHKQTIQQYWQQIARFLKMKNLTNVFIFQDGLPEGGDIGRAIIDTLAQTGSPNYRLLKRLAKTGAQFQKTEDPELLKQEYQLTKDLVARKDLVSAVFAFLKYKLKKNKLLRNRDDYIAKQINQNLPEGETGICFLGAYHDVMSKLSDDIHIVLFKNPDKIKQYYQRLARGETAGAINDLARYLTKPVKNGSVGFNPPPRESSNVRPGMTSRIFRFGGAEIRRSAGSFT
jgi:hypothetical protein